MTYDEVRAVIAEAKGMIEQGLLSGGAQPTRKPGPHDWVCPDCGSDKAEPKGLIYCAEDLIAAAELMLCEVQVWQNANTDEIVGETGNECWCPECECHMSGLTSREKYEAENPPVCPDCGDPVDEPGSCPTCPGYQGPAVDPEASDLADTLRES